MDLAIRLKTERNVKAPLCLAIEGRLNILRLSTG
jgi:hypothetical protein